jgi:ABC-type amino acid transport substrate-binding protein
VTALFANEVDGIVETRTRLLRSVSQPETVRLLEEPVSPEPYAIAVPRQDVNLRNLVNSSLQYLARNGRIQEIHDANMPEVPFHEETVPIWANLSDDAPRPDQFPTDITYPQQYILPRVMNDRVVRVAGLLDAVTPETPENTRRLDAFNRQVIETMAGRWGVTVQYVPNSAANPLDFVANGQADIALGVQADWAWADRVDFTQGYFMRGYRLMVGQDSAIEDFVNLRGSQWVAVDLNDVNARTLALAEAAEDNVRIEILQTDDAAFAILVENNADAAFGDTLWLLPQLEANGGLMRLTEDWYARSFLSMAVPRNDIDFRLLVEYTLQDISQDGTLATFFQPILPAGETFSIPVWPGATG